MLGAWRLRRHGNKHCTVCFPLGVIEQRGWSIQLSRSETKERSEVMTKLPFIDSVWGVVWTALFSRLFLLTAMIISNALIADHNASGVFIFPQEHFDANERTLDEGLSDVWKTFTKWDAAYFLHIARDGYQFEAEHAFFPLYPVLIKFLARVIALISSLSVDKSIVMAGISISIGCFVLSTVVLWYLLSHFQVSACLRSTAVLLFILNPANVFFTTVYTESLFSCLTFGGMVAWETGYYLPAVIVFALASATRSNGVFAVVFVVSHVFINDFILRNSADDKHFVNNAFRSGLKMLVASGMIYLPFIVYSIVCYCKLCNMCYIDMSLCQFSEWFCTSFQNSSICERNKAYSEVLIECDMPISTIYGSIQKNYWGVGFMRYYLWKQLPNFMLAFPVLAICFKITVHFFTSFGHHIACTEAEKLQTRFQRGFYSFLLYNRLVLPYLMHMVAIMMIAVFYAHIQISTRLLFSSCPLLCLHLGQYLESAKQLNVNINWLFLYFASFNIMGVLLHPNYFPWT